MTLRTRRARLVPLVIGFTIAALGGPAMRPAAAADPLPTPTKPGHVLTLKTGQTITANFDDLIVGAQDTDTDPATCTAAPDCDTIQLRFKRDFTPGALNFVTLRLEWDPGPEFPDLVLAVAGLGLGHLNDLDMYVWDNTEERMGANSAEGTLVGTPAEPVVAGLPPGPVCDQLCFLASKGDPSDPDPGGHGVSFPEIAGFTVTQDVYDLVILGATGVMQGYKLTVKFSNELFPAPLEILEGDILPIEPTDTSGAITPDIGGAVPDAGALDLAPVGVDRDYAGFGLGNRNDLLKVPAALPSNLRRTAAVGRPPSGLTLWVWLGLVPVVLVAVAGLLLRRRRQAFT